MDPAESTGSHSAVQVKSGDTVTMSRWSIGVVFGVASAIAVPSAGYAISAARDVGVAVERLETVVTRVGAIEARLANASALEVRIVALEQGQSLHRTLGDRLEIRVDRCERRIDEVASKQQEHR